MDQSIADLKTSVDQVKATIMSMTTKFQALETCLDTTELKMLEMEMQSTSDHQEAKKQELESCAKILRIQNVIMDKDETVYNSAVKLLVPILNTTPQNMLFHIDHAYRLHTAYLRKAKLPPELFVKFSRLFSRDAILQESQDKNLEFKGNKIQILKEIPWHVQKQCKEYFFLIKMLTDLNIQYKWPFLKGLSFSWEGKQLKLASTIKAHKFDKDNAPKLGYNQSSEESSNDSDAMAGDFQQSFHVGATAGEPKPPRHLRPRIGILKISK